MEKEMGALEWSSASSPSATERENGEKRGVRGVLSSGANGDGGGVRGRRSRVGQKGRWIDAVPARSRSWCAARRRGA